MFKDHLCISEVVGWGSYDFELVCKIGLLTITSSYTANQSVFISVYFLISYVYIYISLYWPVYVYATPISLSLSLSLSLS